jgi:drug/metabolite transporter (DMT)-like permease
MGYLYIFGTIFFTVYGQIAIKFGVGKKGTSLPEDTFEKIIFLIKLVLFNPLILSGLFSAFIASFFWMAALTKFDLGYAYPFMALTYVFVLIASIFIFHEPFSINRLIGVAIIVVGVIVASK